MKCSDYDLVAIGSGPAGESAAELAALFGHSAAIVEKARPGGAVTTTGGVPTKTLREAALRYAALCDAALHGLSGRPELAVVTEVIRNRTWSVCELLQRVTVDNIARHGVDYIQGLA